MALNAAEAGDDAGVNLPYQDGTFPDCTAPAAYSFTTG